MKNTALSIVIVAVVVGVGAFYGGMRYAQSKAPVVPTQRFQQAGASVTGSRAGGRGGDRAGMTFASGEIVTKDASSITVKLRDGGSKIVLYTSAVPITKTVSATSQDLKIGETISANGTTNQDGSITAQSVQLRPAGMDPGGPGSLGRPGAGFGSGGARPQ